MAETEGESARVLSMTSLLRTIGKIGRPSGRGLFMLRALTSSTLFAGLVGLCGAAVGGALLLGGGQLFLIGSCAGFVGAAVTFYKQQVHEAFIAFDNYPELMRLHLMMNYPNLSWSRMKLDPESRLQERLRIQQSWAMTSMLCSAYQTASSSIDEIHARQEQQLIEKFSKGSTQRELAP